MVEQRDQLRLALVANLEVFLLERRDEPAVAISNRREDTDVVGGTAKGRLLRSRAQARQHTRQKDSRREDPDHTHSSHTGGRHRTPVISWSGCLLSAMRNRPPFGVCWDSSHAGASEAA